MRDTHIQYIDSAANLLPNQLPGFFVGWPNPPSLEMHLALLRQSDYVLLALDPESDTIVGFITAISDHVLCAYIPLLEVLPSYQGQGIGRELLTRMLEKIGQFYMVDVMCDAELQPFYAHLGMKKATGMMLRNYSALKGEE